MSYLIVYSDIFSIAMFPQEPFERALKADRRNTRLAFACTGFREHGIAYVIL